MIYFKITCIPFTSVFFVKLSLSFSIIIRFDSCFWIKDFGYYPEKYVIIYHSSTTVLSTNLFKIRTPITCPSVACDKIIITNTDHNTFSIHSNFMTHHTKCCPIKFYIAIIVNRQAITIQAKVEVVNLEAPAHFCCFSAYGPIWAAYAMATGILFCS